MSHPVKPLKRCNGGFDNCVFCVGYMCFIGYGLIMSEHRLFINLILAVICMATFLVVRILRLLRERIKWNHLYTNNSELLLKCLSFTNWKTFVITLLINVLLLTYFWTMAEKNGIEDIWSAKQYSQRDCVYSLLACLIFIVMGLYFQWDDSPLSDSYRLESSYTFSGGSCMALGYFYGYLKLILPNLLNKINDFQCRNSISHEMIPEKKLFILIPSSTFIFDQLRKTGDETIEPLEEMLEPHLQDRGMVLNRLYKNTMYKIKRRSNICETKYYVPLEGASPLKTFEETWKQNPKFKDFRREVISAFFYTLETLIEEDKNIRGLVELIYYDDEKIQDLDVADLVRSRIKYLKKRKKRKISNRNCNNLNITEK